MDGIEVRVDGQPVAAEAGSTVAQVLDKIGRPDCIAALLNNHVVGLDAQLHGNAEICCLGPDSPHAVSVLRRTVALVFHAATTECCEDLTFHVGQSLGDGYYYEVRGPDGPVDLSALAERLSAALHRRASSCEVILNRSVPLEGARNELSDPDGAKESLLQAWASPMVPLVTLGAFSDIQHGPYAPHAGFALGARVVAYPPGLVLVFPGGMDPRPDENRALWSAYAEARDWNRRVGAATVGELNRSVLSGTIDESIQIAEALHEKKIVEIADAVGAAGSRVVFVAGPSSSGKTTFVRRLAIQLRVLGANPVFIGLDDYYRPREECPRDENGEHDFEALDALDLPLLHQHLQDLLAGRPVVLPRFDFSVGARAPRDPTREMTLGEGSVLIVEGIHGLNPALTSAVPGSARYRVFVSALTQLAIDPHNRILTADTRLLRRIVRDRRYRNTRAAETIARWPSVRRGEALHIFPHQDEADAVFNSALGYEAAVLRTFAWRYLLEVPRSEPARAEAFRLLKFLELFVPIFPDAVPANSVLREFIGGSGFVF